MKPFAFVFPGQGSQSVGMLDAWGDHPAVRATLQEASAALGEDIARLIHEGPLMNQAGDVFSQRRGGFLQGGANGGVVTPGIEHADRLGPLTGEDEGERLHASVSWMSLELVSRVFWEDEGG